MIDLAVRVANKMTCIGDGVVKEVCPIGIININNWEWPQGVGLFGLFKFYAEHGKKEYLDYIINWYDARIAEGLPSKNVNTMAPMLTLTYIYEETKREDYLELIKEWSSWVMTDMPRTEDRGLQHIVSGEENKDQLWVDTLYMTVLFLARAGVILNKKEYIEEAKHQFLVHIKYLHDKKTGFWFHGWSFDGRHNFANAFWARGNCWYTACVCEFLNIIDVKEGALYDYLRETLISQVDALVKVQASDGGWHTLLDDESSYEEASATAGFGYGILRAVNLGFIDEKYRECGMKALEYVVNNIDDEGTVQNVSYGTGMGRDLDHYRNIPICPMTYGQAMAILIIMESLNCKND